MIQEIVFVAFLVPGHARCEESRDDNSGEIAVRSSQIAVVTFAAICDLRSAICDLRSFNAAQPPAPAD
jgi:hypothetical protein